MMMQRRFQQVDVFGRGPFAGNPLAVILDGEGLSGEQMQAIARWTNLSETTFVLPPSTGDADYRVRIFSLSGELPFAGHPTLGTCHAWLAAGGVPRQPDMIVQECGAGLIRIARGDGCLAFAAPPLKRSGPVDEVELQRLVDLLGIRRDRVVDSNWIDNGPGWVGLLLASPEEVLAVEPAAARAGVVNVGLVAPYPPGQEFGFEVRALFTDERGALREDPVTGSLNAAVAQWLLAAGRARAPYAASQGARVGRASRVDITSDASGAVWVGGATVTCVEGALAA